MDAREDKKPRPAPEAPASSGGVSNRDGSSKGKDPDLYDPVGMAGQKAGIVQELQGETAEPTTPKDEAGTTKEDGPGAVPPLAGAPTT